MRAIFKKSKVESDGLTVTFFFERDAKLRFIAGQFIELTVSHNNTDDRGDRRWFTLSSSPVLQDSEGLLAITTRINNHSKLSSYKKALSELKAGDSVDISEAMGDFVLPMNSSQPLVFIATGIGITPFLSIASWLEDTKQERDIQLVYKVRSVEDVVFLGALDAPYINTDLVTENDLTAKSIEDIVGGFSGKQVFISGPEQSTQDLVEQFAQDYGLGQDQLITDYFQGY